MDKHGNIYMDENGVHYNLLGITDKKELRAVEYGITKNKIKDILDGNAPGISKTNNYDFGHLKAIHGYLFSTIYAWAGECRTIPFGKRLEGGAMRSVFARPEIIVEKWQALENKTDAFAKARGLNASQKIDALVDIFVDANHIHPFPEGNGRALQIFMCQLAREQGLTLDYGKINAKEWNWASAVSGEHRRLFEYQHWIRGERDQAPIREIFVNMASQSLEIGRNTQGATMPVSISDPARDPARLIEPLPEPSDERLDALAVQAALAHLGPEAVEALADAGEGRPLNDAQRAALRDGWNGSLILPDDRLTRLGELSYSTASKQLAVAERQSPEISARERQNLAQQRQWRQQQQQLQARNIAQREEARDKALEIGRELKELKEREAEIRSSDAPELVKDARIEQVHEAERELVREAPQPVRSRIPKRDLGLGR